MLFSQKNIVNICQFEHALALSISETNKFQRKLKGFQLCGVCFCDYEEVDGVGGCGGGEEEERRIRKKKEEEERRQDKKAKKKKEDAEEERRRKTK